MKDIELPKPGDRAYLITGKVPERTKTGVAINCVFWSGVAYWAISLIGGHQ